MTPDATVSPVPVNPRSRRLESVDILRGLLMLLMAIDHTRDYFSSISHVDPTDPLHSWPALYLTRWMTHLCAPGFIALAGTSAYLQRQRGKSSGQLAWLLLTRGLWLALLEMTVISFGWSFTFGPALQVIWAVGISMVFLSALIWLPTAAIGSIGAVIVLLHNLFDAVHPARFTPAAFFWTLLHAPGPLFLHHQFIGVAPYPLIPWIGVICLGYAFGPVAASDRARRRSIAVTLGLGFLTVFAALRLLHGYGDHDRFAYLATPGETVMSFFQVEKYPPSLHYLLATLGVLLLLYAAFDLAVTRDWLPRLRRIIEVYGRVPFFYYVLHIYLLHLAALILTASVHLNWRFWLTPGAVFIGHLAGWGFGLPVVYLVWFLLVVILYYPCLWFSRIKARRRDWWLSYL